MLLKKFILFCYIGIAVSSCYARSTTDKDIDTQIKMLYERNPILNEKKVHSKTVQQHVTLKGCVRNNEEKELAEDLAGLVDYIDSINNKIEVKNPPHISSKNTASVQDKVSDAFISRLIHAKLMLDPSMCSANIHVKTLKGITILTGRVSSPKDKSRASQIAFKSKGVVDVINKIKVHKESI